MLIRVSSNDVSSVNACSVLNVRYEEAEIHDLRTQQTAFSSSPNDLLCLPIAIAIAEALLLEPTEISCLISLSQRLE